ncbi:MAG: hypothetical protein DRG82_10710 [Deltaproteobacteria bacterium]|nr:MAG: hypothetical protein B1H13_06165 [Desulfobacteraceae bacterium 4484_190.3]RLB15807.1 MAG: hypothetical protein DRG82_10710 [Deltaproteobacteria bacterium]
MKGKMKIFDIQDIFRDDLNQIERTIERIRRNSILSQAGATQPQQKKQKPRDGLRPPKVTS